MSKRSLVSMLTRPLLTGILALLPVGLTLAIMGWLVTFIADLLGPRSSVGGLLKQVGWSLGDSDLGAYAGGLLFALLLVFLLGMLVENVLKERWSQWLDQLTARIPVIRTIYDAAKKVVEMIEPKKSADMRSMTPIMCSFGGTSFPAFLPTSQTFVLHDIEYHVVMIPTAPVPFGGAIMCVPKDAVSPLDCGIDGLFNIYMSMGTMVPDYLRKAPPNP